MQIGQRLEVKQSQQLVMTPQLQQAIKLLQMSNLDVMDFVAHEAEKNPLLQVEDGSRERNITPTNTGRESVDREIGRNDPARAGDGFDTGAENLSGASDRMGKAGEPSFSSPAGAALRGGDGGAELPGIEERFASEISLREHLLAQIATAGSDQQAQLLASLLVDELDDAGYLRADLDVLAERLGAHSTLIERSLTLLQSCDPTGVGARDLRECLMLQLRERDRLDPAMATLLDHLDDLAAARIAPLRAHCGVDAEDLMDMIGELRALNPRPGSAFGGSVAQTVVPDVFVRRGTAGGWSVELNSDALPKVLLDTRYAARLSASGEEEAKTFVAECRQNADWLIRALDQRAQTILKVASEITRRQAAFFIEGVAALRPMTLKSVAEEIGMHESTVSRVTANKYLHCERGLFEMKFFFTQAIAGMDGGDALSATAVKDRIKSLIEQELSAKPLSDDALVTVLKQSGIDIARRTVAKYRESMNIPSSARRKRMRAAALS